MRALVWCGPGVMEVRTVPAPRPTAGVAVLAVERAGICGSDVAAYLGTMGTSQPGSVRGHELSGVVLEVGDARDAGWIGSRGTVDPQVTCGRCWACTSGRDNLCPALRLIGVHLPGGFADQVAVPVANLTAVAADLPSRQATTAEPLAQACHDVRLVLAAAPSSCLVIGAGSIGALVVQAARLSGIDRIAVVEPDGNRRATALAAGADAAVESVQAARGLPSWQLRQGFDVVFEVVGTGTTRRAAVDLVRSGGQVVMVGLHTDVSDMPWFQVVRREVAILGANCFQRRDFAQAVAWLTEGRVQAPGSFREAPLDDAPAVFAELATGRPAAGKTYLVPRG